MAGQTFTVYLSDARHKFATENKGDRTISAYIGELIQKAQEQKQDDEFFAQCDHLTDGPSAPNGKPRYWAKMKDGTDVALSPARWRALRERIYFPDNEGVDNDAAA